MRKFQCFLFMLKRSYVCFYIVCMTVPLMSIVDLDLKINYYTKIYFFAISKQILTQEYFYWYGPSWPP